MPRPTLMLVLACQVAAFSSVQAVEPVDYVRQVKPLLENHCFACHGALKQQQQLRLDTVALINRGGDSGAAMVPGDAKASLLLQVLTGEAGFQMPPEGEGTRLTDEEIDLIARWIDQGAAGPADERPQEDPRLHWSYQPVQRPPLPSVDLETKIWGRNPVDAFIAAGHRKHQLAPQPPAQRDVLLRRLYLDLVGVPPTADERAAFLQDTSPLAYDDVVDRLLADPRYGQRWGRHWMDVWRYSDWYGRRGSNEIRYSQRHIWRWRDWIIASLNDDKGYDRMLTEMLAGDEVAPTDPDVLRATGFLGRNWYKFDRNTWLFETVEQTSRGMLGLTMRCARCHDHKFDPISQLDYYRLRAFFEPHGVRVDSLSGREGTVTDNGKAEVASGGVARVYDADPDTPTYRFVRGDDRRPDKDQPLAPAVPAVFKTPTPAVTPLALPVAAYYPALQPGVLKGRLAAADEALNAAQGQLDAAIEALAVRQQQLVDFDTQLAGKAAENDAANVFLHDDFSQLRADTWQVVSGIWQSQDGQLRQSELGTFLTIKTVQPHPADFRAQIRYTTTDPGSLRSIGVSFDVTQRDWQAIYTHSNNGRSQLHAFHRQAGRDVYPATGVVPAKIEVDKPLTMDIAVRGALLNIWIDGKLKLVYRMPVARQPGRFALWCHSGTASFDELRIEALPADAALAETADSTAPSPFTPVTRQDLERQKRNAARTVNTRKQALVVAKAGRASLAARIEADRAKYGGEASAQVLAKAASQAERQLALQQAQLELDKLQLESQNSADKKQQAAQAKLDAARKKLDEDSAAYSPLGSEFPRQSTGRRLALAKWMTDRKNPRTARVCVNHIWLRHFGEPLVSTVDNFGVRGQRPSHPELLDWLSAELMEHGWSMTWLHRLLVTSETYRMTSKPGRDHRSLARDPGNRYLWRMNSRRMEAEVVRDSLLATARQLDPALGGPDLDEATGATSRRRSLYFRSTPDNKMPLLELFDLANPNECYRRQESVLPQQALALTNSPLALDQARLLARSLNGVKADEAFIEAAFICVLGRNATEAERHSCLGFLQRHAKLLANVSSLVKFAAGSQGRVAPAATPELRARENLIHVLYSHNDFVTIR